MQDSMTDLVAWAMRLLEPFAEGSEEINQFVTLALALGVEPCISCHQRAAVPDESRFLPQCVTCRREDAGV